MIVYRLTRAEFSTDFSGAGAAKSGGRWNSKGIEMIYTSESRALCVAEVAVHVGLGNIPLNYLLVTFEIPGNIRIKELNPSSLASDWKSFPHVNSTQEIGDGFVREKKFLVLKVPSAVVQGDSNFLINPNHPEIKKVKIVKTEPFNFDERLFIK
ncbi:MAG TPA: RES family NAD+ phosphorylase [Chitinophagales bacterium]|nr:RES family NAD+ phosphorylase [Chitinophagales bacterium]